tara:strand:- start:499 stop:780 length:282 start_codon:yes stop_codon:yes gene_type:complete
MSAKKTKKADIVTLKGFGSHQIGIVDKIFNIDDVPHAIVRWIKPTPNRRSYISCSRLKTLRTQEEAQQRGRKKVIPGLEEGSETHVTRIVTDS